MVPQPAHEEPIDEALRRTFERAWLAGEPLAIEECLPPADSPAWLPTLEELVHIELEFAWKAWGEHRQVGSAAGTALPPVHPQPLAHYLARFPALDQPEIVRRLAEQEYFVRTRAGDREALADFRERYGDLPDSFSRALPHAAQTVAALDATRIADLGPHAPQAPGGQHGGLPGGGTAAGDVPLGRIGNYALLDEIGRGGMGIVFRARQLSADRIVALKVIRGDHLSSLRPAVRTSAVERFRHEALAAARLEHEHIVTVYEVGEADGERYFSMRYVEGQSLAELLAAGPLAGRRAAAYLEPIARAVAAAHEAGILHRDLKPQNILVDRRSDKALVADFGLAKLLEQSSELTRAGDVMGTPSYMSPEQARDSAQVTPQSDVYSLGATLYHTITGRPPFQAATTLETLLQVQRDEPVPPSQLNRAIDRDLETICLTCLAKEPARRYATAALLAEDLGRYLAGVPILARPVGPLERLSRWCCRNPLLAGSLGAAAMFLLCALAATSVGYIWTTRALTDKTKALADSNRSYQQARQVVDQFFVAVSEDLLLNQPGAEPLRNQLLQLALAHDRQFLDARGQDPALLEEIARSHFRVGQITRTLDPSAAAGEASLREALRIQQQLAAQANAGAGVREALSDTLCALAEVHLDQNDVEQGLALFEQARQLRLQLADEHKHQPPYERKLASAVMNVGLAYGRLQQHEPAAAALAEAQRLRRTLLAGRTMETADDTELLVWRDLAMGGYNQARYLLSRGRRDEARTTLDEVLQLFERLTGRQPGDLNGRLRLAIVYRLLGHSLLAQNDNRTAAARFEQAVELLGELHRHSPRVADFQEQLALAHIDAAAVYGRLGQLPRAVESLEAATRHLAAVVPPPDSSDHRDRRLNYATALLELSRQQLKLDPQADTAANLRLARQYLERLVGETTNTELRERLEADLRATTRLLQKPL